MSDEVKFGLDAASEAQGCRALERQRPFRHAQKGGGQWIDRRQQRLASNRQPAHRYVDGIHCPRQNRGHRIRSVAVPLVSRIAHRC